VPPPWGRSFVRSTVSPEPAAPIRPSFDYFVSLHGLAGSRDPPPLMAAVSTTVLILLLAGGVVYSLGVIVHTRVRIAFHNAAWHGMVVTAAALHLMAIALVLP
jgi:predicted membrane channel-forming protein YqfA (hemolysin III family)